MREEKKNVEEQVLSLIQREKEALMQILERIRENVYAVDDTLALIRKERSEWEKERALQARDAETLLSERALRSLAERELAAQKEACGRLAEENAALLADKQTLLKRMLNNR